MLNLGVLLAKCPVLAWRHACSCLEVVNEMRLIIKAVKRRQSLMWSTGDCGQVRIKANNALHIFDRCTKIVNGVRPQSFSSAAKFLANFFNRILRHRITQIPDFWKR